MIMKYDRCHGFGREARDIADRPGHYQLIPCPECNGCGTTSCCGDSIAQPDEKEDDAR
jgi:hypothetical protein